MAWDDDDLLQQEGGHRGKEKEERGKGWVLRKERGSLICRLP